MARTRYFITLIFVALLLMVSAVRAAEAPALMLATRWSPDIDPTGWWMSEKYDGMRGYWDGTRMLTRQGGAIAIPDSWRSALPDFPVDGELWAGRGRFEQTVATVRDRTPGPGWSAIHYLVFDAPGVAGPFETRVAKVKAWLRTHPSDVMKVIDQRRCEGRAQLESFLRNVEKQGGEGIMLRAPGSPYVAGRSDFMRKVKSFEDTEATVVGYNPGSGKYRGMVGSLRVELPNGTRFSVGSGLSDQERRTPPPLGSVITFKYQGWTAHGKPRFPVYWRVRELPRDERADSTQ